MIQKVRKNPWFPVAAASCAAGYVYYLIQGWWLTDSRLLNTLYAAHIFGLLILFLYYLYYRYIDPDIGKTVFQRRFYLVVSAFLVAGALAVWGFNESDSVRELLKAIVLFPFARAYLNTGTITAMPMRIFLLTYLIGPVLSLLFVGIDIRTGFFSQNGRVGKLLSGGYVLFVVSILALVFSTNILQAEPGTGTRLFKAGTESLVLDRLRNDISFLEDLKTFGGFLYKRTRSGNLEIYFSRTGFYGSFLKLLQDVTKARISDFLSSARITLAALLAVVFGLLAQWIRSRKGLLASIVFLLPVPFTYWIAAPAKDLIWFYFLFFLPFLVSLLVYPRVQDKKTSFKRFCLYVFLAFIFNFLHGYEFIASQILSAAVPVFYYEFAQRSSFRSILRRCFLVCLTGMAAFSVVFTLHIAQLSLHRHSIRKGLDFIWTRAGYRIVEDSVTYGEIIRGYVKIPVFYFSEEQFRPDSVLIDAEEISPSLPWWNTMGVYHLVFLALLAIVSLVYAFRRNKSSGDNNLADTFNIGLTGVVAMFSSWTWFAAKQAMSTHYHQNGIMFMVPFGIVFYLFLGFAAHTLIEFLMQSGKSSAKV